MTVRSREVPGRKGCDKRHPCSSNNNRLLLIDYYIIIIIDMYASIIMQFLGFHRTSALFVCTAQIARLRSLNY